MKNSNLLLISAVLIQIWACTDSGLNPVRSDFTGNWTWTESVFDTQRVLTPQSEGYSQKLMITDDGSALFFRNNELLYTKKVLQTNSRVLLGSNNDCLDFSLECITQTITQETTQLVLSDSIGGGVHYFARE